MDSFQLFVHRHMEWNQAKKTARKNKMAKTAFSIQNLKLETHCSKYWNSNLWLFVCGWRQSHHIASTLFAAKREERKSIGRHGVLLFVQRFEMIQSVKQSWAILDYMHLDLEVPIELRFVFQFCEKMWYVVLGKENCTKTELAARSTNRLIEVTEKTPILLNYSSKAVQKHTHTNKLFKYWTISTKYNEFKNFFL